MKFSEAWLKEWISPPCTTEALIQKFELSGFEMEKVKSFHLQLSNVVIGKVLQCQPHPLSKRLKIARVQVSDVETVQIVCGATNCRAGIHVACAMVGARLPNSAAPIERVVLRNTESLGMLCSASELGLSTESPSSEGILELEAHLPIGSPLTDYLIIQDNVLSLGITPNRGDCLSILGLARETGALFGLPVITETRKKSLFGVPVPTSDDVPVAPTIGNIESFSSHYCTSRIQNIQMQNPTPLWIQQRLLCAGIRTINLCVDILNYVMLELGQPMHAYDAKQILGPLCARYSQTGEEIKLLNDATLRLTNAASVIISDAQGPLGLAGIIGAERGCLTHATDEIIIEAAGFLPAVISPTVQRYNLNTEASSRFERGIDPAITQLAVERATQLILQASEGAKASKIHRAGKHYDTPALYRSTIALPKPLIEKLLGISVVPKMVEETLVAAGFGIQGSPTGWSVDVPTWRTDIEIAEDVCDCFAKLIGYENIPSVMPYLAPPSSKLSDLVRYSEEQDQFVTSTKQHLVAQGYFEAITFGFCDADKQAQLIGNTNILNLANPISANLNGLRLSPLPNLLQLVYRNQCRQQTDIRFFEIGRGFVPLPEKPDDKQHSRILETENLTICWATSQAPLHWRKFPPSSAAGSYIPDFFGFKGHIESLCLALGLNLSELYFQNLIDSHLAPYLHPKQAAQITYQNIIMGYIGKLHPKVLSNWDLEGPVFVAEFNFLKLQAAKSQRQSVRIVAKYPTIRRDLSLVVDRKLEAQSVVTICSDALKQFNLQSEVKLIDCYLPLPDDYTLVGKKGLTVALCFQCTLRTLSEEEIKQITQTVVETLKKIFGIQLRANP